MTIINDLLSPLCFRFLICTARVIMHTSAQVYSSLFNRMAAQKNLKKKRENHRETKAT